MLITISINEWIGVSCAGLWFSMLDEDKVGYRTKQALIKDLSCAKLDTARTAKIRKIAAGHYEYIPKCCDTGRYEYGSVFTLIKLTADNIGEYRQMLKKEETIEDIQEQND
jgi:hypothetical protein